MKKFFAKTLKRFDIDIMRGIEEYFRVIGESGMR